MPRDLVSFIMMRRSKFVCRYVKSRSFGSCPLLLKMEPPSSEYHVTHKDTYFSLADELIARGLFSSARKVIYGLFFQISSVPEAILAINFALLRGMDPDNVCYTNLVNKLNVSIDTLMAEALYMRCVMGRGVQPDSRLLNYMTICYSILGKLDESLFCFHRLFKLELIPWVCTCDTIVTKLVQKGMILEAYDCLSVFSEASSVSLHFCCYNKLLDGLCSRGFLDEGLHVFDMMIERGILPTANVCKSLIIGFCRWGRVEEAEILCAEIEGYGFVADVFMFTYLINRYCKVGKMKMGMRLFFRILKMGFQPDVYLYNTLIHGFANLCLFSEARMVQDMMVNSRITPNIVTYQIMLNIYCKTQQVNQAMMLLNDMLLSNITPNVHCFTVVLGALCKEHEFDKVHDLYCRMVASGVVPDHVLFFTLVKNCPEGDGFYLAHSVLQVIANRACNIEISNGCISLSKSAEDVMKEIEPLLDEIVRSNSVLAVNAFSIYIIALCQGGKLDSAMDCLEHMLSHRLLPTITAFNSLLKLLIKQGLTENAEQLLEFMQDKGFVPDQLTFLVIVDELCKQEEYWSAIDILEQIEERGIQPNVWIYNTIVSCLGKHKLVNEAEKLFNRMLNRGIHPDEVIFITMLVTYSTNGLAHKAQRLFDQIMVYHLRPDLYSYTALIPVFIKKNMTARSCLYLDRMQKDGFMPDTVLYTSLIRHFLLKSDVEFALRLFDLMEANKVEQDHVTYATLICGLVNYLRQFGEGWQKSRKGTKNAKEVLFNLLCPATLILPYTNKSKLDIKTREQATSLLLDLITKVGRVPLVHDLFLHNGIISGLCWTNKMQEAYQHMNLMVVEGVHPNCITFSTFIGGHMRAGEMNKAVSLFNQMNASNVAPDRRLLNYLIVGFCVDGRIIDAFSVVQMMQKKGFYPSKCSYEALIRSLCYHSSTFDDALRIYQDMVSHNYVPSCSSLHCLSRACCIYPVSAQTS